MTWDRALRTLGATDGRTTIWLHPHLSQTQRRCTLAHELAHIDLGHTRHVTDADERDAQRLAARRLIRIARLADAMVWTHSPDELAEELWVDTDTLEVRLDNLHPSEHHYIAQRLAARDGGA